jgi:hypothetical protein
MIIIGIVGIKYFSRPERKFVPAEKENSENNKN